ncbi:uncharacterized protein LODBEIA_P54890 [Lodderomyces beijingensis]|uniref:Uncharacterized protein n=1 Tax=Lodderomyces beijingensis TaxID=1775926 RepID=A0ABP0ZWH9_9ASCO
MTTTFLTTSPIPSAAASASAPASASFKENGQSTCNPIETATDESKPRTFTSQVNFKPQQLYVSTPLSPPSKAIHKPSPMTTSTVEATPRPSPFSKRVSFNNLNPEDDSNVLSNQPIYNQAGSNPSSPSSYSQFKRNNSGSSAQNVSSLLSGVPQVKKPDIVLSSVFMTNANPNHSTSIARKRRLKLPSPPEKSILKNRVSRQQLDYNERFQGKIAEGTINYHEDDIDIHVNDNDNDDNDNNDNNNNDAEGEDNDDDDDNNEEAIDASAEAGSPISGPIAAKPRRKSYAEMTDEELMALDPQFSNFKSRATTFDSFKFDNQKMFYREERRSSATQVAAALKSQQKQQSQQQQQHPYPTSNENNYRSIALTVRHNRYDQVDFNRTIVTTISGRKHTWHSLDWLLQINNVDGSEQQSSSFLVDGDHLVVTSLISKDYIKEYNCKRRKLALEVYLQQKCTNLLDYLKEYLVKLDLKVKMTVEFVIDGDINDYYSFSENGVKFMMHHVYKQYQPNLCVLGNKSSNLNFKYPIKIKKSAHDEYMIKISSYIVKYSPVPVVLVGGSQHHQDLFSAKRRRKSDVDTPNLPKITFSDVEQVTSPISPKDSSFLIKPTITNSSATSNNSNSSNSNSSLDSSVESFSPRELLTNNNNINSKNNEEGEEGRDPELRQFDSRPQHDIEPEEQSELDKIKSLPFDSPLKLQKWISFISDQSYQGSVNYIQAVNSKDDSLKIDDKIHQIYKSQSGCAGAGSGGSGGNSRGGSFSGGTSGILSNTSRDGSVSSSTDGNIYKVKSLISIKDDEEVKKKQELRRKRNSNGASIGSNIRGNSSKSSLSSCDGSKGSSTKDKKTEKKPEKKTSFWKKLGFKK